MLPIILDVSELTIAIVGSGPQARRRLQMADAAGAEFVRVYAADAEEEMRALAGDRLIESWPSQDELSACHIVYIANVDDALKSVSRRRRGPLKHWSMLRTSNRFAIFMCRPLCAVATCC